MTLLLLPQRCAFLHCCIVYLLLGHRLWFRDAHQLGSKAQVLVEGFSQQQLLPLPLSSASSASSRFYCRHHDISSTIRTPPALEAMLPTTVLYAVNRRRHHALPLVGQEMPLMDVLNKDAEKFSNNMIQPLPSRQHPNDEMRTLFLYGMPIQVPVHQAIMDYANNNDIISAAQFACFGHLAYKPPCNDDDNNNNRSLIGAIGCAAQILPISPISGQPQKQPEGQQGQQQQEEINNNAVLCRGWYRFIVRKVIQTVPFAVAIVDELVDDNDDDDNINDNHANSAQVVKVDDVSSDHDSDDNDEDEDDEDEDDYADLTPDQLEKRLVQGMRDYVQQQLDLSHREMTPLELSILQDGGGGGAVVSTQRQAAEEMAAVLDVFIQYIIDENPAPAERYYMLAFLAAEMTNLENDKRREILKVTNSVQRLRIVLAAVEDKVGMARARKMAKSITAKSDEEEKNLQIGKPKLPPWALQIRKGMRIEYYWNEEYEWCVCQVVKDPVLLHDDDDDDNNNELVLTVVFEDDDMMTRQLPFRADEKARWRPATR